MEFAYLINENYEEEDYSDKLEQETNISKHCSCSNCMDCLGMSWRDFF